MTSSTVGIELVGNRFRLRLPRTVVSSNIPRYISTGLADTTENHRKAQIAAWGIEADIKSDKLADTYQSYLDHFKPKAVPIAAPPKPQPITLTALWVKYCDYKKPQLAATTYKVDYCKKWANHIAALPQSLEDAVSIRDNLIAQVSIDTTKRLLVLLSACCTWAVRSGLITSNPFLGMSAEIEKPKVARNIDPFSTSERNSILKAFKEHPTHQHYYGFVRFLFLTGCRTGEAIALQWRHIAPDLSSITFAESYSSKLKIRKCTKTGTSRKFPVNADLRELLATIKPINAEPTALVFTSQTGLPIDSSRFTNQVWRGCVAGKKTYRGILPNLILNGAVVAYRCPYTTRHTFITMMLDAGLTCSQVAKLVGNSPEIVLKHYAGDSVDLVPSI